MKNLLPSCLGSDMKILDKITIKSMLSNRSKCKQCLGKGYVTMVVPRLDATKFRVAVPCSCVKQVVRIEDDR